MHTSIFTSCMVVRTHWNRKLDVLKGKEYSGAPTYSFRWIKEPCYLVPVCLFWYLLIIPVSTGCFSASLWSQHMWQKIPPGIALGDQEWRTRKGKKGNYCVTFEDYTSPPDHDDYNHYTLLENNKEALENKGAWKANGDKGRTIKQKSRKYARRNAWRENILLLVHIHTHTDSHDIYMQHYYYYLHCLRCLVRVCSTWFLPSWNFHIICLVF